MTATEWTPTLEDFENWTDDDEQSALDAIASRMKIRHIIKNDEYWALAPGGVIYKLPMFLSIHDSRPSHPQPMIPKASNRSNASSPSSPARNRRRSSKTGRHRSRSTCFRTTGPP